MAPAGDKKRSTAEWLFADGTRVDHFRILRPLGRGGMAEVYLARDTKLGRKVALKVIQPDSLGSKDSLDRFLFEARATARFNHPHIVTIHFVGEHEGKPYLALEYLEGQSLRQRMQEDLGVQEVLRIGLAIAEALKQAHGDRIIHRDLKPENVWLARDGRVRVLDFGLAKAGSGEQVDTADLALLDTHHTAGADTSGTQSVHQTAGKGIRGTPAYMAPEQWHEQPVTGATDVWALGVMLHELLAGRRPFVDASVFQLAMKICGDDPAPQLTQPGLPAGLSKLVGRCLGRRASERPTAGQVAQILAELLAGDRHPGRTDESPFRGLLPFDESQRHLFFGREAETSTFVERLRVEPVLAVIGPSGAGKSSFVQAGVVPRLREKGPLEVIRLRPGNRPFYALASRLEAADHPSSGSVQDSPFGAVPRETSQLDARPRDQQLDPEELAARLRAMPLRLNLALQRLADRKGCSVLLFVDQLEELYTLVHEQQTRVAFMQAVCLAADDIVAPVRVVLTLREEFISRLAEDPRVRDALSHVVVLRSPGPEQLRETLVRPLEIMGYAYDDPGLPEEMIAAISGEVSCLPLLQFTGQLLWERRDRRRKTLQRQAYEEMGGVAGALARHADGVFAGLSPEELQLARAMLLRLVTAEGTRRLLPQRRVVEGLGERAPVVLRRLTSSRLVSVKRSEAEGAAELELAHESLVATWGRLRRWVEEDREELAFLAELEQAAALWRQRGRPAEEVWRGQALQEALRRTEHLSTQVSGEVREFLQSGEGLERRRTRRKKLAVLFAFAALLTVATVLALMYRESRLQSGRAEQQRQQAEEKRAEALREGARAALARGDVGEARAKLRMALELAESDALLARSLWWQLQQRPLQARLFVPPTQSNAVAFTPDGTKLVVGGDDGSVYVVAGDSGRILQGHPRIAAKVSLDGVSVAPDGRWLAVGTRDCAVILLEIAGSGRRRLGGGPRADEGVHCAVAFHPDGTLLASVDGRGLIRLRDVASGKVRRELRTDPGKMVQLAFSPDGRRLAALTFARADLRSWELGSGEERRYPVEPGTQLRGVAFSPDGKLLASSDRDGRVRLWEVASGKERPRLGQHDSWIWTVVFSPDNKLVATGSADGTARLWDLATGEQLALLDGHASDVLDLAFSPDGRDLVGVGTVSQILRWNVDAVLAEAARRWRPRSGGGVDFHPDGRTLVSNTNRRLLSWDIASGRVRRVRAHPAGVSMPRISPDGTRLATASEDGTWRLWDDSTGALLGVFGGGRASIAHLAFHPAGGILATSALDGAILLWDIDRRHLRRLKGHANRANQIAFSPDGRWLLSASNEGRVTLWETATGASQELSRLPLRRFAAAWSPDGRTVAYSDEDTVRSMQLQGRVERKLCSCQAGIAGTVAFSPRGEWLAVGCGDGEVAVVELDGTSRRVLRGHTASVADLRFDPSGRWLASTSLDRSVRVWAADSGRPRWRGLMLETEPPLLFTHRGWARLPDAPGQAPPRRGWERAASRAGRASMDKTGLCLHTHDNRLQYWHPADDREVFQRELAAVEQVLAVPDGCVVRGAGGEVRIHRARGRQRVLHKRASAIARDGKHLLVATPDGVDTLDLSGAVLGRVAARGKATAIARIGEVLAAGYPDGALHLVAGRQRKRAEALAVADTSPVVRVAAGPPGAVVAGFGNGLLVMWDIELGTKLYTTQLHGAVSYLYLSGNKLYAATDLGDHQALDLGLFFLESCDLLRQVWRRSPCVWEGGQQVLRAPPAGHRCAP